ncbi:TlpA disulfide reductase family protein [Pedobacter agri]|uniref:TlpA disulfide reductase family protein n=1 Tax=Pedobacter agri TaxID=454586 RepID=UPI002783E293|nr:TlpA disulfide reductase family protein [Pedobacter agri]MDQ1142417.1 thiol-disulfide isomerase/thioredoxin [Pedobacter agri]
MNRYCKHFLFLILFMHLLSSNAKAQIDYRMIDFPQAVKLEKLIKILDLAPTDIEAHYWYLNSMGSNLKGIAEQYNKWMKSFPKEAIIPYQLGHYYIDHNDSLARIFLSRALAINPKIPKAWVDLYSISYFKGDDNAESILERGIEANPEDSELMFRYAYRSKTNDPKGFLDMMARIAKKKKIDKYNVRALCLLINESTSYNAKVAIYEDIKNNYLTKEPAEASQAMLSYYLLLLDNDIEKTKYLIYSLLEMKTRPFDWGKLLFLTNSILSAQQLIVKDKPSEALAILKNIEIPYFLKSPILQVHKLKNTALAKLHGNKLAIDSAIYSFIKHPSKPLYDLILDYRDSSLQDSSAISIYVKEKINQNIRKASVFKLKNYLNNDSLTLDSLRGKVVLLSYWYPQCGPCRAEMPYFEQVLNEYNDRNIQYITINIQPNQAGQVINLRRKEQYTFVPLEEIPYRNKGNLDNMGAAPANFIIDKSGNLVFENFFIDAHNKDDLRLMLNLLQ